LKIIKMRKNISMEGKVTMVLKRLANIYSL